MRLAQIYRHPVKSLGSEALETAELSPDRAMPHDRLYAVAHGKSRFDPAAPAWTPCGEFLRATNVPALAALDIAYRPETSRFRAAQPQGDALEVDLGETGDRARLARWLETIGGAVVPGPYSVVEIGEGGALTDSPLAAVSIKSLASLRDLGRRLGATLDPRRFRGNLWLDGAGPDGTDLAPWAERNWIGCEIEIGDARLQILEPIVRCQATAANPETGLRDVLPTRALSGLFDDPEFGVLAKVLHGGRVSIGDAARRV